MVASDGVAAVGGAAAGALGASGTAGGIILNASFMRSPTALAKGMAAVADGGTGAGGSAAAARAGGCAGGASGWAASGSSCCNSGPSDSEGVSSTIAAAVAPPPTASPAAATRLAVLPKNLLAIHPPIVLPTHGPKKPNAAGAGIRVSSYVLRVYPVMYRSFFSKNIIIGRGA